MITSALDEKSREDFSRLKIIKAQKAKKSGTARKLIHTEKQKIKNLLALINFSNFHSYDPALHNKQINGYTTKWQKSAYLKK